MTDRCRECGQEIDPTEKRAQEIRIEVIALCEAMGLNMNDVRVKLLRWLDSDEKKRSLNIRASIEQDRAVYVREEIHDRNHKGRRTPWSVPAQDRTPRPKERRDDPGGRQVRRPQAHQEGACRDGSLGSR